MGILTIRDESEQTEAGSEADVVDMERKVLPVGVEDFEKLIKENYYYVDKTGMIAELLRDRAQVNLFTRPCEGRGAGASTDQGAAL